VCQISIFFGREYQVARLVAQLFLSEKKSQKKVTP